MAESDRDALLERWIDELIARHTMALRRQELLKAIRALSARYVGDRSTLAMRSPLDSAGKRAAFAVFYAPLHFLMVTEAVRALGLDRRPIRRIVDLGCGTGAAGAAWALAAAGERPALDGVDRAGWAVAEAEWSWRTLDVHGRARRGDLVRAAERLAGERTRQPTGVVLGWTVNELAEPARDRLRRSLLDLGSSGAAVLVVEPIARRMLPWWDAWSNDFVRLGGRADEWRFARALPAPLADLDEAAGFTREGLTARTLALARS